MDIKTLLEFDNYIPDNHARLLISPAGVGKSSVVKMIAKNRKSKLIDLRLSEYEPADIVGLPYLYDDEHGIKETRYAQPFWWPKDEAPVILFLDEIDRIRGEMQANALQITLDRTAGGRKLRDNVIVFAGANGVEYMTNAMDQALMNRLAVIEFTPTVNEWIEWAEDNGVHASVIAFIRADPGKLDTPYEQVGVPNIVVPSRRTWAMFGMMLVNIKGDIKKNSNLLYFAESYVGKECAAAFVSWVVENYNVVKAEDVFNGTLKPSNLDMIQIMHVAHDVAKMFMSSEISDEKRYNCLKFYIDAGDEAFATLFSALPSHAGFKISKFRDIDAYIKKQRKQLKMFNEYN